MFKNRVVYSLLIASVAFLSACSPKKEECTTGSTKPECQVGTDLGVDAGLLQVQFADSYFYDLNTDSWSTVKASELNAGVIDTTVAVYSSYLNLGLTEALNSAQAAKGQKEASLNQKNQVPYIEFAAKDGVRYLYRYQKQTLSGTTLVDEQGIVPIAGARAILPLVNAAFNNQYFTSESTVGSRFKNIVSITAENNKRAGPVYQVQFQSMFAVQSIDFLVNYSQEMQSYSLPTRWKYYNNASNTGNNTNLPFFTLEDRKSIPTSVPVDARVLFKAAPKLQLKQEIFFELPFQGDLFKVSGTVVPDRGHRFYISAIPLSSERDFGMRVSLGGEPLTQNSLSFEKFNFPIGRKFDINFAYDFTPNVRYGAQAGGGDPFQKGLLYPLRPVCYEIKDQVYQPWIKEPPRNAARAQGRYYAICDLDETKEVSLGTSSQERMDTWYDFFSYAPYRADKNELGHFYGLKSVTFVMEACVKIQVKAAGDTAWQTKTQGGSNCGDANSDTSWTQVYAEKTFTIFDYVNSYKSVKDLTSIIERFKSSSTEPYPTMKFNNEMLNGDSIRHVY